MSLWLRVIIWGEWNLIFATVMGNIMLVHYTEDLMLTGPGDQEVVILLINMYARGQEIKPGDTQKPDPQETS